jgi:diacylglycerol kinase family enzyme
MKIAIVLNGNARSITAGAINKIHRACGERAANNKPGECHVFVSKSLKDARHIARLIVNDKFDVVMSGGGDGTFVQCVTDVLSLTDSPPAFGMLKMGTGNALADVLGIGSDIQAELDCACLEEARTSISLVKTNDVVAPFAGFGLDAMVLNDYDQIKGELDGDPVFKTIKSKRGVLDYGFAITLRSIWKLIINAPR